MPQEPQEPFPALVESLVDLFAATWYIWALLAAGAVAQALLRVRAARRLERAGMDEIDRMDGTTFEFFLGGLFRGLGYRVEHTGRLGDFGADLVVTRDGRRAVVQAKRWSKRVGIKAVQEAAAARSMYSCDHALVVTNSSFTDAAKKLARATGVELWDRDMLVEKRLATAEAPVPRAPEFPACVECGAPVTEKVRNYCLERPSRFGGRVYCFPHQRGLPA